MADIERDEAVTGQVHAPRRQLTDAKKLEMIGYIIDTQERNSEDEDGDSNLADLGYMREAIDAVLGDVDSPVLREYLADGAQA